jgi:hypothetical protein
MAKTRYVVFQLRNGVDTWDEIATDVEASSPKAAMRLVAEARAKETDTPVKATFGATPVRNWTTAPVGVEIQTRITVG